MSGQRKYADTLWECYYEDADAVVFVVDAAESDAAVEEARVALTEALVRAPKASKASKEGKKTKKRPPLAVFANKSDVPAARTASELASAMLGTAAWRGTRRPTNKIISENDISICSPPHTLL